MGKSQVGKNEEYLSGQIFTGKKEKCVKLLVGKNPVGNNSVVKVFRPRFPGQVFSRYFLYPIYSLFWIYHRARKSYISFSFLRFSMHEESTQLLLSLLLYPENVCHPTTFSLQNLQESPEKKTRAICDVTASFSVLLLFSWGLFLFRFNWIA